MANQSMIDTANFDRSNKTSAHSGITTRHAEIVTTPGASTSSWNSTDFRRPLASSEKPTVSEGWEYRLTEKGWSGTMLRVSHFFRLNPGKPAFHRFHAGLLVTILLSVHPGIVPADDGYFSDGSKQLTYREEGVRTLNQRIAVWSLGASALLAGGLGTLYAMDSRSLSQSISASGMHTLRVWDSSLEGVRNEAVHSATAAKIYLGIGGSLAVATLVTYLLTTPESKIISYNWQAINAIPKVEISQESLVLSGGWQF